MSCMVCARACRVQSDDEEEEEEEEEDDDDDEEEAESDEIVQFEKMRVEALRSFGFRLGRSLSLDLGEHLFDAIKHVWMSILCHEIDETILEDAFVLGGCIEGWGVIMMKLV